MPNDAVSIDIGGAKLTVATNDLFRAWLEKNLPAGAEITSPAISAAPRLAASGEHYVGMIASADGRKRHHIILLPGEVTKNWNDAMAWATSIGGDLPDRVESALLFFGLRDQFQKEAYWTNEQYAGHAESAWCQTFGDGSQDYYLKSSKLRARAVRREPIR